MFRLLMALLAACCLAAGSLNAQEIITREEPLVQQMVENWIKSNRSHPGISGWRVQLMATTERQQVELAQTRFLSLYPGIPADWSHEKPYYKLRVGAFRTRQEARAFIAFIYDVFPGSYPAQDAGIPPRDFLKMHF